MKVTVYSADWCGPCKMMKATFKREGIEYTTIDVDGDTTAAAEAKIRGVPTIVITKADGKEVRIVGFSNTTLKRVKKELGLG
jgi:glutaredoxin